MSIFSEICAWRKTPSKENAFHLKAKVHMLELETNTEPVESKIYLSFPKLSLS